MASNALGHAISRQTLFGYNQHMMLGSHIDKTIITQQAIAQRVRELALEITQDLSPPNIQADSRIIIIPVMTGAMIFCSDLIRHMPLKVRICTLRVRSYPGSATSSQGAKLIETQLDALTDCHLLLVDDILDSGNTLNLLTPILRTHQPASLRICVLLRKDRPEARSVAVDYIGFDIPDTFVVGYGLDYDDYYRNLPNIVSLKGQFISGSHHPAQSGQ